MIEINDVSEIRQLESGEWKAAIKFNDEFIAGFLAMKKRAKETGQRLCIVEANPGLKEDRTSVLINIRDMIEKELNGAAVQSENDKA